jgi:hypothetical protein
VVFSECEPRLTTISVCSRLVAMNKLTHWFLRLALSILLGLLALGTLFIAGMAGWGSEGGSDLDLVNPYYSIGGTCSLILACLVLSGIKRPRVIITLAVSTAILLSLGAVMAEAESVIIAAFLLLTTILVGLYTHTLSRS